MFSELAEEIGYPVIIKAAGGGGGIGMQIVKEQSQSSALKLCMSRVKQPSVMREYLLKSTSKDQHVEFQVWQMVRMYSFQERFCSIQRRHQNYRRGPWLSDEKVRNW